MLSSRKGKERKGRRLTDMFHEKQKKLNKQKVRNSGEKKGGGGVIIECGSENQDYFTSSVLRMGTYFNTS